MLISVRLPQGSASGILLVVLLWNPGAAGAEKPSRQQPTAFADSVQVTEVQVPVTVVGKDGLPVRSLELADFELSDNGRRQEIVGLKKIDLQSLEPGWTRSQIENAVPAAARRYFLLLFDHSFSKPGSIRRAQQASQRFVVDALHPTDLAAVAVLTPEAGPKILVTFTPDRAQLARAIDTVADPELMQLARGRDPLLFMLEAPTKPGGVVASSDAPVDDDYFRSSNLEVQGYLDLMNQRMSSVERSFDRGQIAGWSSSMEQLAKILNSLRGRKYLVYFSEGFSSRYLYGPSLSEVAGSAGGELTPLEQSQAGVLDSESTYGSGQLRNSLDQMLREFRRADCVIEAIDLSGLGASAKGGKGSPGSSGSLFYLANETGGEVFGDASNLDDQLEVMLRRSAMTYLLTFRPTRLKEDGSYHRLKVKATLPQGARLTHRAGYYAPRPFDELHPIEKDLLIADAIAAATPATDVEMHVLAAPFAAGGQKAYVPVVIEIPGGSLVVGHESDHLPVEIYAYVTDQQGAMRDFFTHVLTFNLVGRREVFRDTGLKYYGHLDLEAGSDYLVRVVVRNGLTGRTGVETVVLDVPDYSQPEPALLPPFFVEPPQRWFLVREQPPEELAQEWIVYPFTIDGEPFVPAVRPRLQRGEDIELCLIAYNLGVEDIRLVGSVLAEDGAQLEGGEVVLTRQITATREGVDKLVARFDSRGLKPGAYRLRLALQDPSWGEATLQQVAFEIVD